MLLPFWTDGCIGSMEGLYFEASGSTPYHFLTAIALRIRGDTTYPQHAEATFIATPNVQSISREWAVEIAQWGEAPGLIRPQNRLE